MGDDDKYESLDHQHELIYDYRNGEVACCRCGEVLQDHIPDSEAHSASKPKRKWRRYIQ